MFFIFLILAGVVGYIVYQQYLTPAGNQPSTTSASTDPVYPSQTPKPAASSGSLSKGVDGSKFAKSSLSKTPLVPPSPAKKSRTPRPIQVITLGIGGDDLAPGVVKEAQPSAPPPGEAPPAPVEAAPTPTPEPPKAEEQPPKVEEAPKPAPTDAAPEVKKPEESAGREATTAQEPSDVTQDSNADAKKAVVQTPTPDVITAVSPAPGDAPPVVSQSPTPDVITARSPAPSELPSVPPPAEAAAAPPAETPPAPAPADDQKPSEDVKTAQVPGENSTKESKSDGQSPVGGAVDANNNPIGAGGSEREKAKDVDANNNAVTQSAPAGPVDPNAALAGEGKKKKKKKSKSKKSKGEKSEDGEKKKKSKKRSKKSKDGKKKKSKKGSSGAEKESEKEAAAPAPDANNNPVAPPPPPADANNNSVAPPAPPADPAV